ncbi:hypothetical protein H0X32_01705 [Patescibacteria group bacterium]|nr:hypothetical protein [Patescibacteria group bacterium]
MSFFSKKERSSVALIDISSSSIAGGLAHLESGAPPTLYYTLRLPVALRDSEEIAEAMKRTLVELTEQLVKIGSPILRKETGNGHITRILTSVGAPWQATSVRTESITALQPFVFTRALLTETTRKNQPTLDGFTQSGEAVIATLLNGYEMANPFGKKVKRAELIILSSLLEKTVAESVEKTIRKTYHTHALTLTAFAPVAYAVFRDVYPHEKNFLVLNVSGETTDIAFIKQGLLVSVTSMPQGINELTRRARKAAQVPENSSPSVNLIVDAEPSNARFDAQVEEAQKEWLSALSATLQEFASHHALPRTLFLLADDESRNYLKNLIDEPALRTLWLTDEPLTIVPSIPSHFAAYVKTRGEAESDLSLFLLALFSNRN